MKVDGDEVAYEAHVRPARPLAGEVEETPPPGPEMLLPTEAVGHLSNCAAMGEGLLVLDPSALKEQLQRFI